MTGIGGYYVNMPMAAMKFFACRIRQIRCLRKYEQLEVSRRSTALP